MKHSKKEWISAITSGIVYGVIVVVVGCLLLKWFHDTGAEILLAWAQR